MYLIPNYAAEKSNAKLQHWFSSCAVKLDKGHYVAISEVFRGVTIETFSRRYDCVTAKLLNYWKFSSVEFLSELALIYCALISFVTSKYRHIVKEQT